MEDDNLTPPEWLAVIFFLTVTFALSITAYLGRTPELPETSPQYVYISSPDIYVSLSGAVPYPQSVIVPRGATIGDLLKIIELSPEADTSKLNKKKVLRKGQRLKIPQKKKARLRKNSPAKPKHEKAKGEGIMEDGQYGPEG